VSPDRVLHPLRRVGARGEGRWQRIPWDEALTRVADAILDAHQGAGPQSFVVDAPHIHAGSVALSGIHRLAYMLGGLVTDLNVAIGDDLKGILHTFGTMQLGYSADNFFDAELIVLTNSNLSATGTPIYHFLTGNANGSENLSPRLQRPRHAISMPLRTGTDAALLGVPGDPRRNLLDAGFVREQMTSRCCAQRHRPLPARWTSMRRETSSLLRRGNPACARAARHAARVAGAGGQLPLTPRRASVEVKPVLALLRKLDRDPRRAAAWPAASAQLIRGMAASAPVVTSFPPPSSFGDPRAEPASRDGAPAPGKSGTVQLLPSDRARGR
jgi:hypothetical protein